MSNTKKFEICGTSESADTNPRREWDWLGEAHTLRKAQAIAKRVSKMKMWHEVELQGFDEEGERVYHSYWQNGKLEIDMGL